MRTQRPLSHALAAVAACGLVLSPVSASLAQSDTAAAGAIAASPPGTATPETPAAATAEPPARVGRLASLSGTVSFHTADEDHWDPATLNYPLTSGDALWTEPAATAAVEISASRISLASSTEFDLDQLDEHGVTVTQAQGETFLDLRDLVQGDSFTIRTPRGIVSISAAGQYDVFSGDTQSPTTVSVIQGAAQLNGDNLALALQTGQTATVTGTGADGDAFKGSVGPLVHTAFMDTMLAPAGTVSDTQTSVAADGATATASATASVSAPAIAQQMPGCQDLRHYGTWRESTQYGRVWRPAVAKDWVPYRDGHWAYVAPWGWTWIDDEPWGFAPFHYGRWVQDDGWAWAPTYYQPGYVTPVYATPVYAPALVTFFGVGPAIAVGPGFGFGVGVGIGIGIGLGFGWGWGHVGWAPLGWGEPYHPWFGGPRYYTQVNRYVTNTRNFYNNSVHNVTINNYANMAAGSTVVPTSAMVNSQRASTVGHALGAANLSQAHLAGTVPAPRGTTQGVTARFAQAQHLPDAAAAASRPAAPGPRLAARAGSPVGGPGTGGVGATPGAPLGAAGVGLRGATASEAGHAAAAAPAAAARGTAATPRTAGAADAARPSTASAAATLHPQANAPSHPATAAEHGTAGAPGPRIAPASSAGPTRGGLPALRSAGPTPRAGGGAPGPAITPRGASTASAAAAAPSHGAPGPAITHGPATAAGLPRGLPNLRDHVTLASANGRAVAEATRPGAPGMAARGAYQQPRAAAPGAGRIGSGAPRTSGLPRSQHAPSYRGTPAYHGTPSYRSTPRAETPYSPPRAQPQYRAPGGYGGGFEGSHGGGYRPSDAAPRYQAPRYQAPRYQAPRYQAPRYDAPRYQAPRAFHGGGGRHPYLP